MSTPAPAPAPAAAPTPPQPPSPAPSVRRALAFSVAQKYAAFLIHLAMTVILARLLSPHDTGIFSLAAAAVGLGQVLRDFGMADYVIAQRDVSREKLRAAFTLTVMLAWSIAAALLLLSFPLAAFYKEPQVAPVLQMLCLNFMLLPFGTVSFALLTKQLQFGRLFVAQTGAAILGAVVTVVAAWRGHGALSMAVGSVVASLWTIGFLALTQPGTVFIRPLFTGLGNVFRFGGTLTASRLLEQAASRSTDFIVAGFLGFHAAGLFSKAMTLIASFNEFFNSAVVRVATPIFAQTAPKSAEERARYIQATVMVATALWLFFPFLGVFAHEIVLLLFGASWLECVPVVQLLCIGAMGYAPYMLSSSMLTARGAVRSQMRIQLVAAPVWVLGLLLGAQVSLVGMAVALNLVLLVRYFLLDRAMRECLGLGTGHLLRALLPSALLCGSAALAGWLAHAAAARAGWPLLPVLMAGGAATAIVALGASWRLRHPLFLELQRLVQSRTRVAR